MHFLRASFAEHTHEGTLSVTANDGVVNNDEALASNHGLERVQLQTDTELADGLRGLNEGSTHVSVLDQTVTVRNAGLFGVTDSSRNTGFGGGHDQVSFDGVFAGELTAHFYAGFVDATAGDGGVRASEVNVLEDTTGGLSLSEALGTQAVLVNGEEFAGLNFTHEGRADNIKCRGFGCDNPAALQATEHEGAYTLRIACGVEGVLIHEGEAEGTAQGRQQVECCFFEGIEVVLRQQGGDECGVGGVTLSKLTVLGGLAAVLFEDTVVKVSGIGEVTVVRQTERAVRGGTEGGLCVSPVGCAGGGVSGVADSVVAGHGAEGGFVKDLGDESHIFVHVDAFAVTGCDTC